MPSCSKRIGRSPTMRRTGWAICIGLLSMLSLQAKTLSAQYPKTAADSARLLAFIKNENRHNYRGWNGLTLYCDIGDVPPSVGNDICRRVFSERTFLAATSNLPVDTTRSAIGAQAEARIHDNLVISVIVIATGASSAPMGLTANIRAWTAAKARVVPMNPAAADTGMTRSGDLIFWERNIVGATTGDQGDFARQIAEGINAHIRTFLAAFIEARK